MLECLLDVSESRNVGTYSRCVVISFPSSGSPLPLTTMNSACAVWFLIETLHVNAPLTAGWRNMNSFLSVLGT